MTSEIKIAVASNSLGKSAAGHAIRGKLQAAKAHGFDGVELAFECLDAHASTFTSLESRKDRLCAAANDIFKTASSLGLGLIALNPFGAYDGLKDPRDVDVRLQEAELWCQLCHIMRIGVLQMCTAVYGGVEESRITNDPTIIAGNMRKLGHLAQGYGLRVAYEAPSWGIHNNTWQQVQRILELVSLPNVGHCLDTFHIATREAGDPFNSKSPIRPNGLPALQVSLDELKRTVDPNNIVYLQLSDATVADPKQMGYPRQDLAQPPFMTQSRNCRIYPCEEQHGGCLPVVDVAKTVFDLGYRGWVSMEVFHTDMWEARASVPDGWAARGIESWKKLSHRCGLRRSKWYLSGLYGTPSDSLAGHRL